MNLFQGLTSVRSELPLQVEAPLMRQRLDIIRRERINVNRATHSGWRSREDVRVGREVGTECIRLHLNPVLRRGRSR